jgi:hypothetical protein
MLRGGNYLILSGKSWLFIAALLIGTFKSLFMLDKAARKNIIRITGLNDGACLGGVYSIKMWGLIACMIVFGRLLRVSGLPFEYIGILYGAIGWALMFSSRLLWKQVYTTHT